MVSWAKDLAQKFKNLSLQDPDSVLAPDVLQWGVQIEASFHCDYYLAVTLKEDLQDGGA